MKTKMLEKISQTIILAALLAFPLWMNAEDKAIAYEDYPSEIGLRFGGKLREAQLESVQWELPNGPALKYDAPKQQAIVDYAWEVSRSKDFLYTLRAENGTFDPQRQSDYKYSNGVREDSWGVCQVNRPTYPNVVNAPRFFSDVPWQIRKCWEMFQENPYRFMAYKVRWAQAKYFKF